MDGVNTVEKDRRVYLEGYFKKYPEAPREMIVKLDLLTSGVWFSDAAMDHFDMGNYIPKSYRLFSWDSINLTDGRRRQKVSWPEEIRLRGGTYKLLPTVIQVRLNPDSPYVVDIVDGCRSLCVNGQAIADVLYLEKPPYYDLVFEDGTNYSDVGALINWGTVLFSTVNRICQFAGDEARCKFCDINPTLKGLKDLGQYARPSKKVDQLAEVARALWEEELMAPRQLACVNITGGAILGKMDGLNEGDFYSRYVRAISEKMGKGFYIFLETTAHEKATWQRWKEDGCDGVRPNIEVWGEDLFNTICPGKAKAIGFKRWVELLIDAVDVFGGSNVQPILVSGVEMCRPYGLKGVKEAVEHTLKGVDFLMGYGMCPRLVTWHIEANSILGDNASPPLDYFIQVNLGWHELWRKHNLPNPSAQGPMGPGVAVIPHGVWMESSFYHR